MDTRHLLYHPLRWRARSDDSQDKEMDMKAYACDSCGLWAVRESTFSGDGCEVAGCSGHYRLKSPKEKLSAILLNRGVEYGDFRDQGEFAQQMKEVVRDGPQWPKMPRHQREAIDMILHKIARIINGNFNNADSWLDIEGYARISRERIPSGDSDA